MFNRGITTLNSGMLGVRFRERIIDLANTVHCTQQPLERLDRTHAMAAINNIQSQIYKRRTAAAWKSINEFCGRKSTP